MKTTLEKPHLSWMAQRLRALRVEYNKQRREICDKLGMNRKTYEKLEEGLRKPSVFTVKKICEVYNITMDQFMEGSPV